MKCCTRSAWNCHLRALAFSLLLFLAGTAFAQTGPGNAIQIAGTVNYVAVPHSAAFNSLPITVMAWVNTTATLGIQGLVNKYAESSFNGWNIFLRDGRVHAFYFVNGSRNVWGGGDGLDGGFIADGRWHHIALVVNAAEGAIYVDGSFKQSRAWTGASGATTTSQEVRIGSYPGGNNGFVGSIFLDEVSVWNTSMNVINIQNSRNGFSTGLEASRLAYYLCDEASGTTVLDSAPLGGSNNGTWSGLVLRFAVQPTALTQPASAVGFTQATLNGLAIPNRSAISAGFQWGTTTSYSDARVMFTLGGPSSTTDLNYSLSLTNLTFDTTYHFRAFATNSQGVGEFSIDRTFRTLNVAETRPATAVRLASARLNGSVTTLNSNMTAWFEWGPTTNYGNLTPPMIVAGNSNSVAVSADIAGQLQGQTLHFRLVATNAIGRGNGADFSFAVPTFPDPTGVPPLRSSAYDGSQGSFVSFDARAEWDLSVAMTIEGWVYRQETNRVETLVSHGGIAADSYMLGFSPRLRFQRGTNFAEVPRIVPARKWTHVAVSYDGAAARFYINGALVGTRVLSNTGTGKLGPLTLGDDGGAEIAGQPRNRLQGNLDEIRIWSVARSSGEISDGLYREVRGEAGLMAVFPRGGQIEEISGLVGTVGIGVTEQVLGMMPRELVVPRSPVSPVADGIINLGTEYLGADLLVLRYPDFPEVDDGVARFIRTDNDLFVALVVNGRLGNLPIGTVGLFVDTTNARPALAEFPQIELLAQLDADTNHTALLNGDGLGGYFACFTPPGLGQPQPCTPRTLWQATQRVCGGEIFPDACVEFRVSRSLLGSFNEFDGVALGLFNVTGSGDQSFTPEDSLPNSPANWVTMTYGNGSATLPRVRWNGRVFASPTNAAPPLVNHPVSLFANDISHTTRTGTAGQFSFDVPMPVGQSIRGQPGIVSFALQGRPEVGTNGVQPLSVFTNGVLYPALPPGTTGVVQLASANFFLQPPPGVAAITGASPASPQCGRIVRQGEAGGAGERVTLTGTNLHGSMQFFLAPVSATFPISPGAWTLLSAEVKSIATDGTSVVVEAPFVAEFVQRETNGPFVPAFDAQTQWRWVAYDPYFRPGRLEYSFVGDFAIRPPPYPIVHGFRFDNQGAGGRLNEFLACYGRNAYICGGVACVPDPLYWGVWYFVYDYWMEESGGSCVGLASTAMQIHNGLFRAVDFDPLDRAFTANGLLDPGFPGDYDTSNFGGRSTRPPIPNDVWAHARANHGAQTSLEYLLHGLGQTKSVTSFSGFPTARLNEIRASPAAFTVSVQLDGGNGHCVTPYRVEDNFTNNPNHSRIWVYDNEKPCAPPDSASSPCVNNAFIDVDLSTDKFTFGTTTGDGMFAIPQEVYNGRRTSPITLLGAAFQLPQLMMLFMAGSADAHYTSPQGEWGWRADGTFVDNFPGLRAVVPLGSSANRTRSIPVFLLHSNNFAHSNLTVQMNVRAAHSNLFHVSDNGISLQLESMQGTAGHSNRITLGTHSNQLASFRFTPQAAHSNFISRVGMSIHSNASVTFQWAGLAGQGGRAQEFRALRDRRAVEYCNEATHSNRYSLRIDAVSGAHSNNACAVFGPFDVPPGAVHCVVLHEWPRARTVRSELDLDADGTPDRVDIVTGTEIDTDGDGIPDAWETRNQLNPEIVDCDDDADNDGISNLGEYLTDTDPSDPLSALRLTATIVPGNKVRLSWRAVPGRRYEVHYAEDLWHIFRPLTGAGFPRVATSTEESFEEALPAGTARTRFYQVRMVP
jgi:Concanavalin A-like lectin/glucanases superfamily